MDTDATDAAEFRRGLNTLAAARMIANQNREILEIRAAAQCRAEQSRAVEHKPSRADRLTNQGRMKSCSNSSQSGRRQTDEDRWPPRGHINSMGNLDKQASHVNVRRRQA
jgi:hypothetical protein